MYRCFRLKRFLLFVAVTALAVSFCTVCAIIRGRSMLTSAYPGNEAPVPLPVVMYHSVCNKAPSEYSVTPAQLEEDLEWLSCNGFCSVSADQLIKYTRGCGVLPEKPVLITFDDGFYNNLSLALPILEKYDMCAVVSIVGRYTDEYAAADPHADSYSYLTWQDISALLSSGRIEIGSHTYDMHSGNGGRQGCAMLSGESTESYSERLKADIDRLRSELHERCGTEPVVFAYPFGALSAESLPVLRDSGILITLTCREGINYITRDPDCLYGIFRFNRSGLLSADSFMSVLTEKLPAP